MSAALVLLLGACAAPPGGPAQADSEEVGLDDVELTLSRSASCACCLEHETYLREAGVRVRDIVVADVSPLKDRHRIPAELRSCHTSEVAGYVVEGHVPLAAIERLIAERPEIDGIALPGMPAGSPGMGGVADGPLVVLTFRDGVVAGEFGRF